MRLWCKSNLTNISLRTWVAEGAMLFPFKFVHPKHLKVPHGQQFLTTEFKSYIALYIKENQKQDPPMKVLKSLLNIKSLIFGFLHQF